MKNLTITIPTGKPGHVAFFILEIAKQNFFTVLDMDFSTIEKLQEAEKTGLFNIQK